MKKTLSIILSTLLVVAVLFFSLNLGFRAWVNEYVFRREVVDQETNYTNRKGVEDAARSLLTQYDFAKREYETYKVFIGSDDKAKEQRALDAKTSTNMVVSKYNNYLTENRFIFKGNLPNDVPYELEPIE